jgi:flagellar hook-associated protein 2
MAVASSSAVLDVPSLVSQLMTAERKPIDKLNAKVSSYQTKISSFGTLSGLVSSFQAAAANLKSSVASYSATPSDASVFSATAASTAAAGTYSIAVAHLARAQNLVASGQMSATAAISSVASTVTFDVGGTATDIAIGANASLEEIRTAINAAGLGVMATIVNDGSGTPYRLALSATKTGLANSITSITIKSGGDASLNSLLAFNPTENPPAAPIPPATALTEVVTALDASLTVNGIAITSASNTITEAIQGVTLTLKSPTSTPATLTIARDTAAINTAATSFVDTYNALASQLKSRSAYGSAGSATPVLSGDTTVRQMQDQLRGIFNTPASGGTLSYLSEVGISIQTDSTLKLDSSKFSTAIADNFSDVSNLFSSATGFATRLNTWATSVVQPGGLIDTRTTSLNTTIKGYTDQISKLETRMTALQKQYTTTFTNLNMMLSNMNATSAYLTSQFSKGTSS